VKGTLSAAALAVVAAAIPSSASAETLAQWPLDEGSGQTTADASGHGHDGRLGLSGAIDSHDPDWVAGRFGNALRFDGDSNDFVTIKAPTTLRPARITVQAWVRRLGSPGSWRYIVSSGASACDSAPYGLYSGFGGGLAFYVSDKNRYVLSGEAPASAVWDGNWHFVGGTYDGQRVRLYVDGAQVGSGTPGALGIHYGGSVANVFIGTYRGSCDLPFTGDIDDIAINDRALTPGQIAGAASRSAKLPAPPQPAPVAGPPPDKPADSARGCPRVGVNPKRLVARLRTSLRISVRKSGRAAVGVRVTVRGSGVSRRARTGRKGLVRVSVRPRRRGRVRVTPRGLPRRCTPEYVRVRAGR
jgi:hypothetical protein